MPSSLMPLISWILTSPSLKAGQSNTSLPVSGGPCVPTTMRTQASPPNPRPPYLPLQDLHSVLIRLIYCLPLVRP